MVEVLEILELANLKKKFLFLHLNLECFILVPPLIHKYIKKELMKQKCRLN